MSSRVLKKLHGEPELELHPDDDEPYSDIENDVGTGAKKKQININRYAMVSAAFFRGRLESQYIFVNILCVLTVGAFTQQSQNKSQIN